MKLTKCKNSKPVTGAAIKARDAIALRIYDHETDKGFRFFFRISEMKNGRATISHPKGIIARHMCHKQGGSFAIFNSRCSGSVKSIQSPSLPQNSENYFY